MNRCLIFVASLILTFVTISSACSARPGELGLGPTAPQARQAGYWGASGPAVTPSRLVAIETIGL